MKSAVLLVCLLAVGQTDPVRDAERLTAQGHPWRATQMLAPVIRNAQTRTPAAILAAARAAAGWGGWPDVDKLLANEPWIDTQFDGDGRELLARSALERNAEAVALTQAAAALGEASAGEARGRRLVLLARALERNNQFDSAAVMYSRAGDVLVSIHDWLALRAAGNERDSSARARTLATVALAPARPRRAWTDAEARERFGDTLGAAARYAALGATVASLRLRLAVATDNTARVAIQNDLLSFIKTHNGTADAKAAADAIDKAFPTLSPGEELIVARSSAISGPPARAVAGFQRALAEPSLMTPADHMAYAQVLLRVNRARDAFAQFDAVQGPLAGQSEYQRGRAELTAASGDVARATLKDVVARFPTDTAAASAALFLLADLSTDDGNDQQAQALYRQLYDDYPTSARAGNARFNAAMLSLVSGNAKSAAAQFDSLPVRDPRSEEVTGARYWSGRAWTAAGDQNLARARWQEVVAQQPTSYYALLAGAKLKASPWTPAARADSFPTVPSIDSAMARAALLERVGMDVEARFELDAVETSATTPDRELAAAEAFLLAGQGTRTMRLAQKLFDGGLRDARTYRLLYPVVDRDEIIRNARAHDLDPALVAGLIRQESAFNPRAVSPAGARGLMQVLPAVGEEISHSLDFPTWSPALLLDADANLELGTSHLASFVKQYGALARVLAAYNAGGSRVTRWAVKAGAGDPEIFAERVPFVETRDYVRIVQRNAEMYRTLYRW